MMSDGMAMNGSMSMMMGGMTGGTNMQMANMTMGVCPMNTYCNMSAAMMYSPCQKTIATITKSTSGGLLAMLAAFFLL